VDADTRGDPVCRNRLERCPCGCGAGNLLQPSRASERQGLHRIEVTQYCEQAAAGQHALIVHSPQTRVAGNKPDKKQNIGDGRRYAGKAASQVDGFSAAIPDPI
jgi:hypothetical protein